MPAPPADPQPRRVPPVSGGVGAALLERDYSRAQVVNVEMVREAPPLDD